jgi:hydroxypyruvate isomerase
MESIGARDLILALHRIPENNMTRAEAMESFERSLRRIANQAAARSITLHLRLAPHRPPNSRAEAQALLNRVNAPNLKLWN